MKKFVNPPFILALLGTGFILFALFWKPNSQPNLKSNSLEDPAGESSYSPHMPVADPTENNEASGDSVENASTEKRSLETMTSLLGTFSEPGRSLGDLLEDLNRNGHKPLLAKDKNPYTGEMSVVRTQNPLPGTRYFHAQYFGDKKSKAELQHMSFEFRSGPQAMELAIEAVLSAFPQARDPRVDEPDYKEWKLDNGYAIWVKRILKEDIDPDHPFNAYTNADVGVIRVAIEADPHAEEHEH